MNQKKAIVIIVSWNKKKLLEECLNSIQKNNTYKNFSTIVVDNASNDGSTEMVEKNFPWVILIRNQKNVGFSKANNQVFRSFEADYYFLLNQDTLVTKNWLSKAIEIAESDERIGVVGCKEVYPSDFSKLKIQEKKQKEVLTVLGGMILIKKKVLDTVGLFDEKNFSPAYGEETDLCFRAKHCGYKIIQSENIPVLHHGSAVITPQIGLNNRIFLNEYHRLKVILFNLSLFEFLSFVPGLTLNFLNSIRNLKTHVLIMAYIKALLEIKTIIAERKKRKVQTKKTYSNLWKYA